MFATGINNPMFPINLEFPKESIILSVEGETDILIENSEIMKQCRRNRGEGPGIRKRKAGLSDQAGNGCFL